MAGQDLAVQDVIRTLDSFYCHNVVAGLWADAVVNRLEGMAIYLLSDELNNGTQTSVLDPAASSPRPIVLHRRGAGARAGSWL